LAKIILGEADAGIVYRSDVVSAGGRVLAVSIPESINLLAEYAIADLKGSPNSALAEDWIRLVLSSGGQQVLDQSGFSAVRPEDRL
jgi:molybdate transport system substrate-binding protein